MNDKENPHVLKSPKIGPQQELSPEAAYLAAVTSIPRLLHEQTQALIGIVEELNGIHDKLDTISLFCERKGMSENLLSPDDFDVDGDDGQPE